MQYLTQVCHMCEEEQGTLRLPLEGQLLPVLCDHHNEKALLKLKMAMDEYIANQRVK